MLSNFVMLSNFGKGAYMNMGLLLAYDYNSVPAIIWSQPDM